MPYKDVAIQRKYQREWLQNNRKPQVVNNRKRRHYNIIQDLKYRLGCEVCSEDEPICLEFHHSGNDKISEVATMIWNGNAMRAILEEIEKCDLLCANCHRKRHKYGE